MLAVAMPGAQRVLYRQVGRPRPLSRVSGLVGYLPPGEIGVEAPGLAAVSRRLTTDQMYLDGSACPPRKIGRIYPCPKCSRTSDKSKGSSQLEIGLGALLSAGGIFLAAQATVAREKPVAMEAAGDHGGAHASHGVDPLPSVGEKSAVEEDLRRTSPRAADSESMMVDGEVDRDGATRKEDDDDREEEEYDEEDGQQYKFYILSESEAAAKTASESISPGARGGGGNRGLRSRYTFVIIGEGSTADAAVESILRMQPEAEILFLSDQKPLPVDDSDTHTGSYESDFRLLKTDLVASFNQWRRHLTFRTEGSCSDDRGEGGDEAEGDGEGSCRSKYGLARGKEIRYHMYQPHGLVIDPERRCVRLLLDDVEIFYDKCLIANSGQPRDQNGILDTIGANEQGTSEEASSGSIKGERRTSKLPSDAVNRLMSLQDFVSLELLERKPFVRHVTVLGGGFVGCEVALALAKRGQDRNIAVSQVYSEIAPLQKLLPVYLAEYMQDQLTKAGVTPVGASSLTDLRYNSDTKRVEGALKGASPSRSASRRKMETDYVVVASTHIDPKVDAASDSGLEIDQLNGGIVVNGLFEAVNGIYAAGSAASFFDPAMGRRRVGSHDHCVNSGLYAGYNMAASLKAAQNDHAQTLQSSPEGGKVRGPPSAPHPRLYEHQPFWRSNLVGCDIVMDGIGEIDPSLRTIGLWVNSAEDWRSQEPSYERGIVYYMRGQQVTGILLLNLPDELERAREVLRLQPKINSIDQLKRLIKLGAHNLIRFVDTPAATTTATATPPRCRSL